MFYPFDSLLLCQLTTTLLVYSIIKTCLYFRVRRKRHQLFKHYGIPGPEPNLIDGNLNLYLVDRQGYRTNERLSKIYGKYFGIYVGDEPSIIIRDLDLLKTIFLERMSSFKERSQIFMEMPIAHSILFARYDRWRMMRKMMSQPFSAYSIRGQESNQFVEDSVKLMLQYIEQNLDPTTGIVNIDIHDLMKSSALFMISAMAIDLPNVQVKENEPNVKSMDEYLSSIDKGITVLAAKFPFLKRVIRFLTKYFELDPMMALIRRNLNRKIDQQVKSKPSAELSTRLIDKLIDLHREGKLTREEVIGNAEAILFAGFDTTSTTLAYIFWVLGKHVDVQERLRDELVAHGQESLYLNQVINETMRLYPTVMSFITRLATETVTLGSLTIPQGARVIYCNWLVTRDPNVWPEPEKFDPERFRAGAEIHPCAFAPFGLGDRKCLGFQLALLEIKTTICDVLMRYRLRTKSPDELVLVSYATVLSKPKDRILVELESLAKS